MADLNIREKRLVKRTKKVLEALAEKPNQSFTQQFNSASELKACYRLFDSDLISPECILEPHFTKTMERISLRSVVVIASDSSSFNYSTRFTNPDSGYISSNNAQGFFIHNSLATTLDRQPLGIVSTKLWARSKEKPKDKIHRDKLPIKEKESCKWLESYAIANTIAQQSPNTEIIYVADREADIIDLFEEANKALKEKNGAHLVVRCKHNRTVAPQTENKNTKLFEFGKSAPVVGQCEFDLRNRITHKFGSSHK